MKIQETLIAWTPAFEAWRNSKANTFGQIKIGPLIKEGNRDWTAGYVNTGGAAYTTWRKANDKEAIFQLLLLFRTLVVQDKLDPMVVHHEFIKLPQYREIDGMHTDEEGNFFYP
ncbi:hypothetical protein O7A70_10050 [Mesorhizobium sp. Cs1299R1N1]|uniref:hypothetical protein n=1 Tax=Mesorhizobium sp. Cs1299R1N1 TaxID=3015172 RepID=UPI00301D384B